MIGGAGVRPGAPGVVMGNRELCTFGNVYIKNDGAPCFMGGSVQ